MSEDTAQTAPVPNLEKLGETAAYYAVITGIFAELSANARTELDDALLKRYAAEKVKSAEVHMDGEAAVAWSVVQPQAKIIVGDADALSSYIEEHHPTEITWEHLPVISPAFRSALLKRAKWDKANQVVVDPQTGQVIEGLSYVPAPPPSSITTKWKPDGKSAVFESLRAGAMAPLLASALELPAGTTEDEEAQA